MIYENQHRQVYRSRTKLYYISHTSYLICCHVFSWMPEVVESYNIKYMILGGRSWRLTRNNSRKETEPWERPSRSWRRNLLRLELNCSLFDKYSQKNNHNQTISVIIFFYSLHATVVLTKPSEKVLYKAKVRSIRMRTCAYSHLFSMFNDKIHKFCSFSVSKNLLAIGNALAKKDSRKISENSLFGYSKMEARGKHDCILFWNYSLTDN